MTFDVLVWPVTATRRRTTGAVVWAALVLWATSLLASRVSEGWAVAVWVTGASLVLVPVVALILSLRKPARLVVGPDGLTLAPVPGAIPGVAAATWRWAQVGLTVERREDGDTLSIRVLDGSGEFVVGFPEGGRLDALVDAIGGAGGRVERQ